MRGKTVSETTVRRRALTDNAADTVRGIGLVALSYLVLSAGDAAAKWAMPVTGVASVLLLRGVFGCASVLVATRGRWRRVVPVRWGLLLARAGLSAFTTTAWYLAWRRMALADTYALGFSAPLLMTLLAVPLLGERIYWRRILSTALGFCGVLVMLRPGGDLWNPALPLLLAGIAAMAVTRIMARMLSVTETPECQAFWVMASFAATGAGLLGVFPPVAAVPAGVWAVLVVMGLSSGLAHCVFSLAYGLAPVSALAPYEYTTLIWGGTLGYAVFAEVPSWTTLAGAAIVAAAG
jgi:drug/metabolite transporter (DMT)-like permease